MKLVVQRVSRAEVRVEGAPIGRIDRGLLVLVAVEKGDVAADLDWCADKVLNMRIFEDSAKKMNLSAVDVATAILVVSQFTLVGDLSRGRRPGFERAAPPAEAEPMVGEFVERLRRSGLSIATGRFRAFMEVELINDGPVTLWLDSRAR